MAWMARTIPRHLIPLAALTIVGSVLGTTMSSPPEDTGGETNAHLARQVRQAEIAFAKTMADRDHDAFGAHVSEEAVFFGDKSTLRGRAAVVDGWAGFFEGPKAPFSWEPEQVEVLESGRLALSTGPVFDPGGERVGTFISTWRREDDGIWRVIFDKGCPPCEAPPQP